MIKDISFKKLTLALNEPFKVAFGEIIYSECILVKVETEEGITGYGEAAPLPFVTGESPDGVMAMLAMLRPGLIGLDPLAIDHIHAVMDGAVHGNSSAKCAIDLAMYDIRGKMMGKPVYALLGGNSGVVQNDITIGIGEPAYMAQQAQHYVNDLGYSILKIKAGIDPRQDIIALREIRKAVGNSVRLRVDANQGYNVSTAVRMLDLFQDVGVEAVEQCLPEWDIEGAAYIRGKSRGIQLMLDESLHSPRDAARICKNGAADILNIKLMKCGGLYPAEQINAIAQAGGLTCMVGCMLETRLAITAGLSLVAAKANVTESDCDSFMYYDERTTGVTGGFTIDGDKFLLSDKPGFGVEVEF